MSGFKIDNNTGEIFYNDVKISPTTYSISAQPEISGGAAVRLTGFDGYTDNVVFVGTNGITVTKQDVPERIVIGMQSSDNNTTYDFYAESDIAGGRLRLAGSDGSNDSVLLLSGANVTVNRTNPGTIVISSVDNNTVYDFYADTKVDGATLRLVDSNQVADSVSLISGQNVTVSRQNPGNVIISSLNSTYDFYADTNVNGATLRLLGNDQVSDTVTLASGQNVTITRPNPGNVIFSSSNTTYDYYADTAVNGATLRLLGSDNTTDGVTLQSDYGVKVNRVSGTTVNIGLSESIITLANDSLDITPTNYLSLFTIANVAFDSYVEVSGVILYKFASGDTNSIGVNVNTTTLQNLGNTAIGFTVHRDDISANLLEVTAADNEALSLADIDSNVHVIRFSGLITSSLNPGPINVAIRIKNSNAGGGPNLKVLKKSFCKYSIV